MINPAAPTSPRRPRLRLVDLPRFRLRARPPHGARLPRGPARAAGGWADTYATGCRRCVRIAHEVAFAVKQRYIKQRLSELRRPGVSHARQRGADVGSPSRGSCEGTVRRIEGLPHASGGPSSRRQPRGRVFRRTMGCGARLLRAGTMVVSFANRRCAAAGRPSAACAIGLRRAAHTALDSEPICARDARVRPAEPRRRKRVLRFRAASDNRDAAPRPAGRRCGRT